MAASIPLLLSALALCATVAYAGPVDPPRRGPNTSQQRAVTDFTTAVNRYAELHRFLEIPVMASALAADPEQTARARKALRAAIREARAAARPGDLFTPDVSSYLRNRIELAMLHTEDAIPGLFGEWAETGWPGAAPAVNDVLPWGIGEPALPEVVEALPELPDELEYRFVGSDLVLLDVEAKLVVDVLKRALPLEGADDEVEPADAPEMCAPEESPFVEGSPCDSHLELEGCWS